MSIFRYRSSARLHGSGDLTLRSLLATALIAWMAAMPLSAAYAGANTAKVNVIVQMLPGGSDGAKSALRALGGKVEADLPIINGFSASLPGNALNVFEHATGVRYVTPDEPVKMMSDPAEDADVSAISSAASVVDTSPTVPETSDDTTTTVDSSATIAATTTTTLDQSTTTSAASSDDSSPAVTTTVPPSASSSSASSTAAPMPVLSTSSVYQQEIGADAAHSAGDEGSGVTVALIDTGVADVPDLHNAIVPVTTAYGSTSTCLNLSGETTCNDSYGHGTFIAGLIAGNGTASNGQYTGVAPGAKILSIKIAGRDGSASVAKILFAIQWVVQHKDQYGIEVLNLSLGTDSPQSYLHDPLDYAVESAWNSGVSVVVAAGNRGPTSGTISKPADDPFVITTGAVDDLATPATSDDLLPDFSSRGPTVADGIAKPDLTAPGAHLISLRSPGSAVEQQFPGGVDATYRRGSGTSEATGVVSGAVALLLSAHPQLTPNEVKYALTQSTTPVVASSDVNAVGAGLINIGAAVANPPVGEANQGVTSAFGDGSLNLSQGSANVVAVDGNGNTTPGHLGAVTPPKNVNPSGGSWYGGSWYGGSWYGGNWYGGSWYGGSWYGGNWYGGSWYGGNWYGGNWYGGNWY